MRRAFTREQRLLVVNGMLSFVLLLVVLQLWLLTATMNAYLGGDEAVIWPAAMASLVGFCLGIGLASFSAAAPLASGWYPARRQGAAMGVYGMGNIGQSMASLGAPMVSFAMGASLGATMGYRWGFWFFALLAFFWLLAF